MNNKIHNKKEKGVTFAEVLAVVAILLIIATGYSQLFSATRQAGIKSLAKQLHSSLLLARSEAMRLAEPVGICRSVTGSSSCNNSKSWQDGWAVFSDLNSNSNMSGNEVIRFYRDIPFGYSIQWEHANKRLFFDKRGRSNLAGEFKICSIEFKSEEEDFTGGEETGGEETGGDEIEVSDIRPYIVISVTAGGQIYKENLKGECQ